MTRKFAARRARVGSAPFEALRSKPRTVVSDDGVQLYAEVDEPAVTRARTDSLTLVFVHGYALNLDCWHFQREELRSRYRLVFYDQRSHGRSGRADRKSCNVDQLGADLAAVMRTQVPDGPVVLIGHSMGGMTIMALADQYPEWFGERVVAVAMLSTSAGGLRQSLNLPGMGGRVAHQLSPAVVATLALASRLVDGGRRASSDLGFLFTRKFAFGGKVPPEYVDFTDEMLATTPFSVIADFYPGMNTHDKRKALVAFSRVPTLLLCGGKDAITPISHSRRIAEAVPSAEFVEVPGAGHMVILERADQVNAALRRLVARAQGAPN